MDQSLKTTKFPKGSHARFCGQRHFDGYFLKFYNHPTTFRLAANLQECICHDFAYLSVAISIGFEHSSYTFIEGNEIINDSARTDFDVIYLRKSIVSEQTFDVVVSTQARGIASSVQDAMEGVEYSIRDGGDQVFVFGPDQSRLLVPLTLFDDELPERREAAQLVVSQQEGSIAEFELSVNATTTIYIEDDGDRKYPLKINKETDM